MCVLVLVAQSCPTLRDPMAWNLPDSSVHGVFQARILEWVAISFSRGSSQSMSDSESPRTAAHQAPPSLGFSREDYWNGLQSILSSLNAVFHCIPSHTEIITMDLGTKEASEI